MKVHDLKQAVALFAGTLFVTGYLPIAPGTWGSLFCLPMIYASWYLLGYTGLVLLTIGTSILSLLSAPIAIRVLGDDPAAFVMDECAGQSLVFATALPLCHLSPDIPTLLVGFLFFRLFDIVKPMGIKQAEKFRGKFGILADDLLAGMYASLGLIAVNYTFVLI